MISSNNFFSVEVHLEKSTTTLVDSLYHRGSDSFYVSEAEKGFLGDHSRADISSVSAECDIPETEKAFIADDQSPKQEDIIEIGSSSDDQDSSKGDNSDTSDSRLLEKSESDEDGLNISYERNIHVEENSRSLVDSDNRTTDDSITDEEIVIEQVEDLVNIEIEVNADSNSMDWVNHEQQSSDDNDEHSDDESVPEAEDQQPENNTEENKPDEVVEVEQATQQNEEVENIIQEASASEINQNNLVLLSERIPSDENIETNISQEDIVEEQDILKKSEIIENKSGELTIHNQFEGISSEINVQSEEKPSSQLDNKLAVASKEKTTNEQSTNTTVTLEIDNTIGDSEEINTEMTNANKTEESMRSKENIKVDQSTNTTVLAEEDTMRQDEDSVIEIDRPKERKMYHPKHGTVKVVMEDQTMSSVSSDTTEGEVVKHEIVVKAEVHTPTKKRTEEPLIRRVTKRCSAIFPQTAEVDILENITDPEISMTVTDYDIMDEDLQNTTCFTPTKKTYVTDILEDSTLGRTFDSTSVFTPGKYI